MSNYHPFIAPCDALNHQALPCEMHADVLGEREGYYYFGPARQAGTPAEAAVAWVRRTHEYTAYRLISSPEQSSDRANIGGGTLGEAEAACASYAHTGDHTVIEEAWEDEPVSVADATAQVQEWIAEADRAAIAAEEVWESLPVADVPAAQAEVDALISRLRREGIAIDALRADGSPARYDAGKHLTCLRQRRDAWRGLLQLAGESGLAAKRLWRALQIWCRPDYPMSALCQDAFLAAKEAAHE